MKLEVKNVSKRFRDVEVLKDVNITFESGKIYGFIGRNGSGKSVLLDNYIYIEKNEFPDDTRALIEKPKFIPDLTGYENLELLASIQNKISKSDIEDTMKKLNFLQEKDKKYSKYSLGTKQKLGIAQVLMEDPKIMIFDEPFNGVENDTAASIRALLKEEAKKDKIIIIASHIREDINSLADIVFEIDGGKIRKL